jgi:polyphosphate kinase
MYRNLMARVEAVVPVTRKPLRERLWDILRIMLNDQRQAWDMNADGTYVQRKPADPGAVGTQQALMALARQSVSAAHVDGVRRSVATPEQ